MSKKKNRVKPNENKVKQSLLIRKIKLWLASVVFQLLTLLLLYGVHFYIINISELPHVYLYLWTFLFSARAANTLISHFYIMSENPNSWVQFNRVMKIKNLISILLLALITFPVLYYSPFSLWLETFFQSVLTISQKVTSTIIQVLTIALSTVSGYIGNILLGVLGNLVYDFGKKLYNRFMKRKKPYKKNSKRY